MFWRMTGLSTSSPVETIMDKDNFKLEDLLDEDEIIQECKSQNNRLINFLRERAQMEQLLRYIVEEAPEDAEKRNFKFPFVSCEIFTCEVDIILKALVEEEELMKLLFSFLEPDHSHSTLLAGYFSKVVISLLLRKTVPFMNYIQEHPEIIKKLVDLIGITSIMEVLIRLISADEHLYTNYTGSMKWLEDTDVLEMIVDKFSSSESPEVHANAAEILCALTRYAPPGLAAKISSPSFVGRLFHHALGEARPKSVLVNSLSVCISLLDPKRLTMGTYHIYNRYMTHGSTASPNPETVEGMLGSLGDLIKLLDSSSDENVLMTTYGKLQPPLGKQRLKIVEFISVLVAVGNEAVEGELIRLGALKQILELFFKYPYNNFLHHHVEHIVGSCLESKNTVFTEHLLNECNLVGKMLDAETKFILVSEPTEPAVPAEGKQPPKIGNIGHITRIANKLVQLGNSNNIIQEHLQKNSIWDEWQTTVLSKRNILENIQHWGCGRPNALQDRTRDSDDDDYQDRDYDVAALANNLSQAFRGGSRNDENDENTHETVDRDDEDIYFDDESAEVVISSLRLGDEQESASLFTNSNWFALEDKRIVQDDNSSAANSVPSPSSSSPDIEEPDKGGDPHEPEPPLTTSQDSPDINNNNNPEWVEWREPSDIMEPPPPLPPSVNDDDTTSSSSVNDEQVQLEVVESDIKQNKTEPEVGSSEEKADEGLLEKNASPEMMTTNSGEEAEEEKEERVEKVEVGN
ncbi:serine/threonine-protein phosphatase 6 regulatory subunit 3-like [Impatiens glandulifera]|uniref:serine/threonine-protein phosphatase 6 regulatory subunit 3-like n=1 Tax=Impatiens glandulifera TaxID=253017 RepID=UPI001FB0E8BC|nr:serine/threonine-protein phosphatase 6 regulatory subunit 3-like [Impatiens glandulifera]